MKYLAAVLVLTAGILPAQKTGGRAAGGVVFTSPGGYGNVAYPGTGHPSFATSLGATIAGRQIPLRNGVGGGNRRYGVGGLGYSYPVFVGGGGYDNSYFDQSGYGGQQQPNVTIINNPPPPALAPTVVINQYMGAPPEPGSSETTHVFQPASRYPTAPATDDASSAPGPHYFLIAYKDHSVYSALTYWIEDKTMHYVTPQQTHNQASLDLIDLDFTKKLNEH